MEFMIVLMLKIGNIDEVKELYNDIKRDNIKLNYKNKIYDDKFNRNNNNNKSNKKLKNGNNKVNIYKNKRNKNNRKYIRKRKFDYYDEKDKYNKLNYNLNLIDDDKLKDIISEDIDINNDDEYKYNLIIEEANDTNLNDKIRSVSRRIKERFNSLITV